MTRQQVRYQQRQENKAKTKISSGHNENLNRVSKHKINLAVKMKDESLVLDKTTTVATLIAERDYYMLNKGARTNSVRDRIIRIESVIVARERILTEMLTKKKELVNQQKVENISENHVAELTKQIKD